ncbi:MAG TPA: PBS lyase [Candidatus Competibacteraceae bacterium]|nr:PBS lyase [Candidatus Competibacteraceae bacterium]
MYKRQAKPLRESDSNVRAAAQILETMGAAAKEQIPELTKRLYDPDTNVRQAAVEMLGKMGVAAKEQAPELAKLLHDPDWTVRLTAIQALGAMGAAAKEQAPELAKLLRDPDKNARWAASRALIVIGPLELRSVSSILSIVYDDSSLVSRSRFLAHFLGGGNTDIETLIAWIGEPITRPMAAISQNHDLAVKTLHAFEQTWPFSEPFPKLRRDLETQIATVAQKGQWKTDDLPLLKTHAANLEAAGSTHAAAVQQVITSVEATDYALTIAKVALIHALFWLVLIAVYPRFRIVQAIFFWNPWIRRFIGLGYIGFALTWIPFLRTKLFAPFKPSLVADAALDTFDEAAYFPDSLVKEKTSGRQKPLREAIPAIRDQIVLEGESGIGKTMFLRSLVKRARRVAVYLPAKKCGGGVLEAIQAKLHGPTQDPAFLRNLIYSGALDICIDGLNEVSADARAKITGFVESYFKGNILMSAQPLEWTPPATAKTYILEPLTDSQIETFLLTRQGHLPDDARTTGDAYQQACRRYLTDTLDPRQPPETLAAMRQLLSNPMDLSSVAAMLARAENPDLFRLQDQQYRLMAEDYREKQLHDFPLRKFAEAVYQMRLQDQDALPAGEFTEELQCLERHKMTVNRPTVEGGKARDEWHFRHDKITDFFIVQAFLGPENDKPEQHLGDARFRGVYLQLARLLPLNDARALERRLIDYAADTQDHTVSDAFIQLLRARPTQNEGPSH